MDYTVTDERYGELTVRENFWTGGLSLLVDGAPAQKVQKREFTFLRDGEEVRAKIYGGSLRGIRLGLSNGEEIKILSGFHWYELIIPILIFAFNLVWGNVEALFAIFPVVGGAIGGAIAGFFACLSLYLMRLVKNVFARIGVSLGCLAASVGLSYLVALALIGAFA